MQSCDDQDKAGCTALLLACQAGHVAVVELLLASGANPNEYNNEQNTALHVAKTKDVAAALLVHAGPNKADTVLLDAMGRTAYEVRQAAATPFCCVCCLHAAEHFGAWHARRSTRRTDSVAGRTRWWPPSRCVPFLPQAPSGGLRYSIVLPIQPPGDSHCPVNSAAEGRTACRRGRTRWRPRRPRPFSR
jgi:hypothetical protein